MAYEVEYEEFGIKLSLYGNHHAGGLKESSSGCRH